MKLKMSITGKFELSDGVTILACKACSSSLDVIGRQSYLVSGGEVRQALTIVGERNMLNQHSNFDQKAFEVRGVVNLSQDEARSENWQLVIE
jgi:hypothetical protein